MKLLVFAHTPPPHHGQSYMVQLMLEGLASADSGIECYHVNARFSESMEDIGGFRFKKIILLLGYCSQAIWLRFRHNIHHFYYIPAPAKRNAIYRDWLILALCRPFFRHIIFHWEAAGLGAWAGVKSTSWETAVTHFLHGKADLSIVLTEFNRSEVENLRPERIVVVPNGIPDPCPDFPTKILPERLARLSRRQSSGSETVFQVLFLAHCTREKGLFDTLEAVALANARLMAESKKMRVRLAVAGNFMNPGEKQEFEKRADEINRQFLGSDSIIVYRGFVSGAEKNSLLAESDNLCFPSFYLAEALPVSMVEALAFGLPIVTTRWRGLPEVLPNQNRWCVEINDPAAIASAFISAAVADHFQELRAHYLSKFTATQFVSGVSNGYRAVKL